MSSLDELMLGQLEIEGKCVQLAYALEYWIDREESCMAYSVRHRPSSTHGMEMTSFRLLLQEESGYAKG
jgi:hypothetical protein